MDPHLIWDSPKGWEIYRIDEDVYLVVNLKRNIQFDVTYDKESNLVIATDEEKFENLPMYVENMIFNIFEKKTKVNPKNVFKVTEEMRRNFPRYDL